MAAATVAWAAIARKEVTKLSAAPPSSLRDSPPPAASSPSVEPLTSKEGIAVAVVDANALIAIPSKLHLIAPRFVTLKEVLHEVKDPASRAQLASLPITIDCLTPTDEALATVVQFARETGDLQSLSTVDLKLLALAFTLESQAYGISHIRTKPPPLHIATLKSVQDKDLPGWGLNVPNLEEWEEISDDFPPPNAHVESHILGVQALNLDSLSIDSNTNLEECSEEKLGTQDEDFQEASTKKNRRPHIKKLDPNLEGKLMVAIGSEASKGQHDVLGDHDNSSVNSNWQKAVSRSTRRKHERRAAARHSDQPPSTSEAGTPNESREIQDVSVQTSLLELDDQQESIFPSQIQMCNSTSEERDYLLDGNALNMEKFAHALELGLSGESLVTGKSDSDNECIINGEEDDGTVSEEDQTSIKSTVNGSEIDVTESEQSWGLQPLSQSTVACITADFAMQNVLLQMGLRVLSPNGLQVYKLHRWVLKCHACNKVTIDVGRIFCPKCGNGGTLDKVSVTIGPNGIVLAGRRHRRMNIRGTRYSLPLPKGGRDGMSQNPILREDQLPNKLLYPKSKKITTDSLEGLYKSDMFLKKSDKNVNRPPVREALAYFSGCRNPNDCHFARKH